MIENLLGRIQNHIILGDASRHSNSRKQRSVTRIGVFIGALLLLPIITSCSTDSEREAGSAEVGVVAQALAAEDVDHVTLTVTGAGISPPIVQRLTKVDGEWTGRLGGIPVGNNRTFHADAYDASNQKIYDGEVTGVTVTAGEPVAVVLLLQQETAPVPFVNSAPVVTSLITSSAQVAPGESVSFSLNASDPDSDPLSYAWTSASGTLNDATSRTPVWVAPTAAGQYTISATVSDNKGSQVELSTRITVASRGDATVTTSLNTWPTVTSVSASPAQLALANTSQLSVVATDNDGDTLSYSWSDNCGGSFTGNASRNPIWRAPFSMPSGGNCTLTVSVRDGRGGTTTGTLVIRLGQPVIDLPPVIDQSFQSTATVAGGETVRLGINAHDPEGRLLTFSWQSASGSLGTANSTASTSEVTWTAPVTAGTYTVSGIARDIGGQEMSQSFTVTVEGTMQASCARILAAGQSTGDGIYSIDPDGSGTLPVVSAFCDMTTDGGGWTKILQYAAAPLMSSTGAVGDIATAQASGSGKLDDAVINAIRTSGGGTFATYRIMDAGEHGDLYVRSNGPFIDSANSMEFGRALTYQVSACLGAGCTLQTMAGADYIDTAGWGLTGNDCSRWFLDQGTPRCITAGDYPQRCFNTGVTCGHAPITDVTMWMREQ